MSPLQEHVSLAPLTTFAIGGTARFFLSAESVEEVRDGLHFAQTQMLPIFILGGGSNVLIADDGFDGLVIAIRIPGIIFSTEGARGTVTAGAGVVWDDLVVWAVEHGYSGLESLSGIPGTVGGAVVANVGAYGAQCSDTFLFADALVHDGKSYTLKTITKEECQFAYHDSVFSHTSQPTIILQATFSLTKKHTAQATYTDNRFTLADFFAKHNRQPTLRDIRDTVLSIREEKGALYMKGRLSYKCAGSFFHMPYVSREVYEQVVERAQALDAIKERQLRPWAWEQQDGSYKLAPGFLLEYTPFQKGYTRGAVGISPKHTLSIINIGGARSYEVAQLAHDMQSAVEKIFGVQLTREIAYIGAVEKISSM